MRKLVRELRDRRGGFTLIEIIVVVAIIGILAAILVPTVANFLGRAKDASYKAEKDKIQTAVDSYYASPSNLRYTGKRTYPLIGDGQTNQGSLTNQTLSLATINDNGAPASPFIAGVTATALWNPVGGTQGADISVKWADGDSDGVRTISDTSADDWTTVLVTRGAVDYHTDPRYFFIDFDALIAAGMLESVPSSASPDNKIAGSTNTYSGNYSWYVDDDGVVQSLYYELPSNTGFKSGVFP